VNIYLCILLLHIIIHIQVVTETEVVGWVMGGDVFAEDYTLSMGGKKLSITERICLYIS
jgi:hypothetical protein